MTGPLLVLCVDGESEILLGRRLVLSIAGYEVLTASCAKDALEIFRQSPVGVVVVDQLLPDMLGTRLIRKLKRLKPDVAMVLLTRSPDLPPAGSDAADLLVSRDSYPTEFLAAMSRLVGNRCDLVPTEAASASKLIRAV